MSFFKTLTSALKTEKSDFNAATSILTSPLNAATSALTPLTAPSALAA
jgi:hypothetical protein